MSSCRSARLTRSHSRMAHHTRPKLPLLLSAPNGLWRYQIGDVVKVVATDPLQIVITGRTKHYINAFRRRGDGSQHRRSACTRMRRLPLHSGQLHRRTRLHHLRLTRTPPMADRK